MSDSIWDLLSLSKQVPPFDETFSLTEKCDKNLRHPCQLQYSSEVFTAFADPCVEVTGHD